MTSADAGPSHAGTRNPGLLLVVSGPSGSGKTTLVGEIVRSGEFPIVKSTSATTRSARPGEVDGVHYHFVAEPSFRELIERDELLEYASVHGFWYGTPREPVERLLATGKWVLLEIDVEGFKQVKRLFPAAVSFFVRTPTTEMYEQRLRSRGADSPETIRRRMADVEEQLCHADQYDFQVVNQSIPQGLRTLRTLLWGLQAIQGTAK